MFNKNFYPTPSQLISEMIAPYLDKIWSEHTTILEPSAGKWDIARYIKDRYRYAKIHIIELDEELREIAKQYGQIVDYDFLQFEADTDYDYIIMNPPFDNWDEHLLKAWEVARNTKIVCILNAETIRNPFSAKRKLLKNIVEQHGTVEFKQNAFTEAERKTGVEIAIVRLEKRTENTFKFGQFEEELEYFGEVKEMGIQTPDRIENIIQDYARAKEMYAEWLAKISYAQKLVRTFSGNVNLLDIAKNTSSTNWALIEMSDSVRMGAWNKIIEELGIKKYMTWKVLDAFQEKMKEQWKIALNKRNINMFVEAIIYNSGSILEENVTVVFDLITRYDKKNTIHIEWWAHNDCYMVNKKFILPWIVDFSMWWCPLRYYAEKTVWDIEKCMAYISGTTEYTTIREAINTAYKNGDMECENEFFKMKMFLKWTVHFTFKSQKLWADFNIRACKWKNWIPPVNDWWKQSNKW